MPTPAQDRIVRGPFGALLILLGLMLSSGTAAAAGFDLRQATRLGAGRSAAAVALTASGVRDPAGDEALDRAGGASLPPSGPALVTRSLWERPAAEPRPADEAARAEPAWASTRAITPNSPTTRTLSDGSARGTRGRGRVTCPILPLR